MGFDELATINVKVGSYFLRHNMYSSDNIFAGTLTQLFASLSGTIFAISDGMVYGWTAPMIPYLISNHSHLNTTKYEAEWLETEIMFGSVCGLPATIYLVDKIGRKRSLLLATCVALICWIVIALADRMLYIHIARVFSGTTSNMSFVAAPMYIAEIAVSKIRGFLSSIIYLMMLLGFVVVYSVGPFCPFYVIPIIGGVVLITTISLFSFMPETPYYLVFKNKPELAKKSLEFFRPGRDENEIDKEMKLISKAIERQKAEKGRIQDIILVKSNRKAIIIMAVLNSGQHFVAISVILMNMHMILNSAGSIYMDTSIAGICFTVVMMAFALISSITVDRYGRKVLLLISTIATSFCLLAMAVYFHLKIVNYDVRNISWIPIVSVMVYAAAFKIGLGLVPIVITAEIFPAKIKAMGMTISSAVYVSSAIITVQLYIWLESSYGMHVPFYIFTAASCLITLFIALYIPETKGKSLEEIQHILKGEKYVPHNGETLIKEPTE